MASDLEKQAKEAFIDDHFELAVDLYTQAIAVDPKNSELYSDRAQANIKSNNLTGNPFFLAISSLFLFRSWKTKMKNWMNWLRFL